MGRRDRRARVGPRDEPAESPELMGTGPEGPSMRDEDEIREQYEFLKEHLDDEEMRHEGVREMFTYYKRALGWVLEEEHI